MNKKILIILAYVGLVFIIFSVLGLGFPDFRKAVNEIFMFATSGIGLLLIVIVGFIWLNNKNKNKDNTKKTSSRKQKDKTNETTIKYTKNIKITKQTE